MVKKHPIHKIDRTLKIKYYELGGTSGGHTDETITKVACKEFFGYINLSGSSVNFGEILDASNDVEKTLNHSENITLDPMAGKNVYLLFMPENYKLMYTDGTGTVQIVNTSDNNLLHNSVNVEGETYYFSGFMNPDPSNSLVFNNVKVVKK